MLRRLSSSTKVVASAQLFPRSITACRCQSETSILGTSTLTPEFLEQFRDDVLEGEMIAQQERKIGGIYASCIRKGELDHMESPDADKRHLSRIDKEAAKLFAAIPEPKDPMRAARAPTREELEENEKFETLKEAVRQRYQNQQRKRSLEASRIEDAMRAVEDGTYEEKYSRQRPSATFESAEDGRAREQLTQPETQEKLKLLQQLEEAKAKMRELQAQLDKANANNNSKKQA